MKRTNINHYIRAPQLRVIAEDGEQLGVMTTREALFIAKEKGLDLVEVSPNANPPVARIIDHGKYQYMQAKKEKESKKAQTIVKTKEVKLKPNIATNDRDTKVRQARKFLQEGNNLKVTITFRGREMVHKNEVGNKVVDSFVEELAEDGHVVSRTPLMHRAYTVNMAPGKGRPKPKSGEPENVEKQTP